MKRSRACVIAGVLAFAVSGISAFAGEPANPELIPEARRVLAYLESVYGHRTLAGMSSYGGWRPIFEMSGRAPALYALDASGWNKPKWGPSYTSVLDRAVARASGWWHDKGGIVSFQFHWGKPGDPAGSAWVQGAKGTGPVDVAALLDPGTDLHAAAMDDLRRTADSLERLSRERVPVLWRPFHEIDGGWFWWTDTETPENTAALWRMMYRYLVEERGLNNLIWVYSASLRPGRLPGGTAFDDDAAYRKRFYPGDAFVDIAGIDIYPNAAFGWGSPWEDAYPKARRIMQAVAPGKMIALCEAAAIPVPGADPDDGARWLYALPWFAAGKANPADWIRRTFSHPDIVTLDELPALVPHNVAPRGRLARPGDGDLLEAGQEGEIEVVVSDPDGNAANIELFFPAEPLRDWSMMDDDEVLEAVRAGYPVGGGRPGADGRLAIAWPEGGPGFYAVAAVVTDAEGAAAVTNVARVSRGLEEYARGRAAAADSDSENASMAVDGDFFTVWNGKRDGPQRLTIDLGEERTVGAVTVSWTKAYAREFRVALSVNGEGWTDIVHREDKTGYRGDTDIIRCPPMAARYVRLEALRPGTSWGGYGIAEIGVYREVPRLPAVGPPIEIRLVAVPGGAQPAAEFPQVGDEAPLRLESRVLLSREHIAEASVSRRDVGDGPRMGIGLVLTPEGAALLAEVTGAHVGRSLAMVVGGRVVCAPVIRARIAGGRAEITGNFTPDEAEAMVRTILGNGVPPPGE